jgi:hypothetical protein
MVELQTLPEAAKYESLITTAINNLYHIALFPPVAKPDFDVGTVFGKRANGSIQTYEGNIYTLVIP